MTFSRPLAMHWNGSRWRMTLGTTQGQPYTEAEPDGKGGVWIAQGGWNPQLWQVRGTSWASTPLPRPTGYDASLAAVARRPGTSQVWGAGFTSPEGDPDDPRSQCHALARLPEASAAEDPPCRRRPA